MMLALSWGLQKLVDGVGVSFEWIVFLIVTLSCLPFFAKDFKLGIIILMLLQASIFVWFYQVGLDYSLNIVMFFLCLVILAISLFAVNATSTTGGFNS